jgi:hypothetical protein
LTFCPVNPTLPRIRREERAIKDEHKSAGFSDAEFERLLELSFRQRWAGSAGGSNPADLEMERKTGFSGQRQKEGDTV